MTNTSESDEKGAVLEESAVPEEMTELGEIAVPDEMAELDEMAEQARALVAKVRDGFQGSGPLAASERMRLAILGRVIAEGDAETSLNHLEGSGEPSVGAREEGIHKKSS